MKSTKVMLIAALVVLAALTLPVMAREGYDNVTSGDTVFVYETIDVCYLTSQTSGSGGSLYCVEDGKLLGSIGYTNCSSVFIPYDSATVNKAFYTLINGTGNYIIVKMPTLKIDVMASNKLDVLNEKTVTKGTPVLFRVTSNVPSGFNVNTYPPYVEIRFTNPDGGSVNVFGNVSTFATSNLTADETFFGPVDTSNVISGTWKVQALWKSSGSFTDLYNRGVDSSVVTFTIGAAKPKITVSKDEVVRGTSFTATITGRGSTDYWLFVKDASIGCSEYVMIDPFGTGAQPGLTPMDQGNVNISNMSDSGDNPADCTATMAKVRTNAAGTRTISFNTSENTKDRTFTLVVAEVGDEKNSNDKVSIKVTKGKITLDVEGDKVYYVGEEIKFIGENTESDYTYLFIVGPNLGDGRKLDDPGVAGTTEVTVEDDNTFEYKWNTAAYTLDAGTYTIYAATKDVGSAGKSGLNSTMLWATTSIQLRKPFLTAEMATARLAKGDKLVITGKAEGKPDDVNIWVFGPNVIGNLVGSLVGISQSVEDDMTFKWEYENTGSLSSGQYFVVVQHPMYNGRQDAMKNTSGTYPYVWNEVTKKTEFYLDGPNRLMGSDAAEALVQVLNQPNIDDTYVKLFFMLEEGYIRINTIGDKYVGEKFTLSGTTNLAVDDTLIITVTSASFRPTEKTQASEFSGASGTTKVVKGTAGENAWSFDVDTTGFKPDQYIVTVECVETDTRATSTFTVSEVPPTTVTTAPPTTEVTTAPPTTTVPPTTTTPPPTTTPGFGAFIALLGLGAVAVLVLRRH